MTYFSALSTPVGRLLFVAKRGARERVAEGAKSGNPCK